MNVRRPLFSVIVPTHQRPRLVQRALASVAGQSFRDYELWVVVDGPDPETQAFLAELTKGEHGQKLSFPSLQVLSGPQRGVSAARNWAARESDGQYLAFLDSDDEWLGDKLKRQAEYLEQKPQTKVLHGEEIWMRRGQRVNPKKKHRKQGGDIFERSLELCLMGPSTVVIERNFFDGLGGFREDFPACEDYDLWLKASLETSVDFIPEFLTIKHGGHPGQLSQRYKAMDYWRVRSLYDLAQSFDLPPFKQRALLDQVLKKSAILLAGYQKYGRSEKVAEVQAIRHWALLKNTQVPWPMASNR